MTRAEAKALAVGDRMKFDDGEDACGGTVDREYSLAEPTVGIQWDDEAHSALRVDDPEEHRLTWITRVVA
jgi:hypothetical protein